MRSAACPSGHNTDAERTPFGLCLDMKADTAWTPRGRTDAGAQPDPTRPFPDPSLADRGTGGVGLSLSVGDSFRTALTSELFGVLDRGVAGVSTESRNGHPWPRPRKHAIARLVERYDEETCRQAAREAREIVQAQDFAPNVTGLFEKRCKAIDADRMAKREEIRRALA